VTDAGGMSAACAVLALVGMLALRARRQRTERGPLREAGRRLAQIDAELALRRT
jgi:hypothetical protein